MSRRPHVVEFGMSGPGRTAAFSADIPPSTWILAAERQIVPTQQSSNL